MLFGACAYSRKKHILRINWKCRCAYIIYILRLTSVHLYLSRGACSLRGACATKPDNTVIANGYLTGIHPLGYILYDRLYGNDHFTKEERNMYDRGNMLVREFRHCTDDDVFALLCTAALFGILLQGRMFLMNCMLQVTGDSREFYCIDRIHLYVGQCGRISIKGWLIQVTKLATQRIQLLTTLLQLKHILQINTYVIRYSQAFVLTTNRGFKVVSMPATYRSCELHKYTNGRVLSQMLAFIPFTQW